MCVSLIVCPVSVLICCGDHMLWYINDQLMIRSIYSALICLFNFFFPQWTWSTNLNNLKV